MIYNHEGNQVSCYSTITQATTQALAAFLASHDTDTTDNASALCYMHP